MTKEEELKERLRPYYNNYSDIGHCRKAYELIIEYIHKNVDYSIRLFEKEELEMRIEFLHNIYDIISQNTVEMSKRWQFDSDKKDLSRARTILSELDLTKDRIASEVKQSRNDLWNIQQQEDTTKQFFFQKWEVWLAIMAIIISITLGIIGIIY